MVQSIGVSFGDTLEQYRDPLLISCSLVLIVVALGYLLLPSVRFTFDSLLAVKVPTTFKRFLGGLLILLPGIFIIATVYFAEVTQALEQRWPGLAARYISKSDAPNRELVAHTTSKGETRDQSSIEEAPVPDSGTTTVEAPPATVSKLGHDSSTIRKRSRLGAKAKAEGETNPGGKETKGTGTQEETEVEHLAHQGRASGCGLPSPIGRGSELFSGQ